MTAPRSINVLLPAAAMSMLLGGCKKEPPPPPPPPPVVKQVDPMEGLNFNPKVEFPDRVRPSTPELAQAITALANAIAAGDSTAADSVLAADDKPILKELVDRGDWASQTQGIQTVRVCTLVEGDDHATCKLGLGVQDAQGAYMLAWKGIRSGPTWVFTGMAIEPISVARVSMLDGAELTAPVVSAGEKENKLAPVAKTPPSKNNGRRK